jgi:hypothetical protein
VNAEALYGLPLERFVPERTALAKELRRGGEREQAAAVAKLRKPSLAAWAVNQLVRTQGRAVTELFDAGDAARQAQSALLAGRGDGQSLRAALADERRAVEQLVEVARGLLSADGHELSSSMLERVAETLHAAALDPEAREQVRDGCLDRELRHLGLSADPVTAAPAGRKPSRGRAALRKAETEARRARERAAKDVEAAQARRDAATRELRQAEADLARASERAREAEAAYRKAQRDHEAAS